MLVCSIDGCELKDADNEMELPAEVNTHETNDANRPNNSWVQISQTDEKLN